MSDPFPNTYDSNHMETTDRYRWRLSGNHGRQAWYYIENEEQLKEWPQTNCERYLLGLPFESKEHEQSQEHHEEFALPKTALEAAHKGFKFYKELQAKDGHWAGAYGGPMYLVSGLIIAIYVTHMTFPESWRIEIIRYLVNKANPVDGGWGMHVEDHSNVLGTTLNYVALRVLGMDVSHPVMVKSRKTLHKLGGATAIPSVGKFLLATMNLYSWKGVNPILPELWLLPYSSPFHPAKNSCLTRAEHLPMSYIYGRKFSHKITPLIKELRKEIFVQPYDSINWSSVRSSVCEADIYFPRSNTLKISNFLANTWERIPDIMGTREMALVTVYKLIVCEEIDSNFISLGAFDKIFRLMCAYYEEGPNSDVFLLMKRRIEDYMWMTSDGMFMQGTNGCQTWDTSLSVQAVIEAGLANDPENHESMIKSLEFLEDSQIKSDPSYMEQCWRDFTIGLWSFSTKEQGWSIYGSTAEALKAVLYLQAKLDYTPPLIYQSRIHSAIDTLIEKQHPNGGYSSYEPIRGQFWLEWVNPSEIFENTAIEHTYLESTSSVLTCLRIFSKVDLVDYRVDEIEKVINKATNYIHNTQRKDGSWFGSWGICFTYATMFALQGLSSVGETYENSKYVKKACDFLISKQRKDGGWGESYKSAAGSGTYIQSQNSQVVNTAWALLGLMYAQYPIHEPIKRGIDLIISRQTQTGEWKQESFEGIVGKNCPVNYSNYKFIFSIWALGVYSKLYENDDDDGLWEFI